MISERLGHFLDRPLEPLARRIRISPNFLTITGFIVSTVAAITLPYKPVAGGVLILLGGAFDMLDGIVARTNGRVTDFGGFLDSLLDRYSDAFILLSVAVYMYIEGDKASVLLSLGTLIGAFLISYARARAEGLGMQCKTGIMERPERIILLSAACLTGYFLPVLWVLFVLTHITVLQRILHVRRLSSSH